MDCFREYTLMLARLCGISWDWILSFTMNHLRSFSCLSLFFLGGGVAQCCILALYKQENHHLYIRLGHWTHFCIIIHLNNNTLLAKKLLLFFFFFSKSYRLKCDFTMCCRLQWYTWSHLLCLYMSQLTAS